MSKKPCRCYSIDCRESGKTNELQFLDSKNSPCEHCGHCGNVVELAIIHLVVDHPEGVIPGSPEFGTGHIKYHFACEKAKVAHKVGRSHKGYPHHFTGEPLAVTCPDCLKVWKDSEAEEVVEETTPQLSTPTGE